MEQSSIQSVPKLSNISLNNNNLIIAVLVILLTLSILGINLFHLFGELFRAVGNIFQAIINIFRPLITQILSLFGYTAGSVINKTSDVLASTAKTGIDIANGTVHSIGNLLKEGGKHVDMDLKTQFDNTLNLSNIQSGIPDADSSHSNIQTPIVAGKNQWCLVGDFQGRRGCVEIDKETKCMSGQIFPSQHQCLNPTLSNNLVKN
jgi:hypothetical protein